MAMIEYSNIDELKICLQNAKESDNIFNAPHIKGIEKLLDMISYSGTIYLDEKEFEILGKYRWYIK